jgi:hypothetical protein
MASGGVSHAIRSMTEFEKIRVKLFGVQEVFVNQAEKPTASLVQKTESVK